jgi:hypothetical protein
MLEHLAKEKPNARMGGEKGKEIEIPAMNGENWHEWKFRMQAFLQSKGLWEVIEMPDKDIPKKYEQETFIIRESYVDSEGETRPATMGSRDTTTKTHCVHTIQRNGQQSARSYSA